MVTFRDHDKLTLWKAKCQGSTVKEFAPKATSIGGKDFEVIVPLKRGNRLPPEGGQVSEGLHTEGCVKSASAPAPLASARLPTIHHWHTRYRDRVDTITVTQHDSIPYPVEVPIEVEKPVPRGQRLIRDTTYHFLVRCSIGFLLLLLALLAYIAKRLYLRR